MPYIRSAVSLHSPVVVLETRTIVLTVHSITSCVMTGLGDSDRFLEEFSSLGREAEKRGRNFYQLDSSPHKRSRYSSIESAFTINNSTLSGFDDTVFGDPPSLSSSESYSFGHPSSPESGVEMLTPQPSHSAPTSSSSSVRLPSNSMQGILSQNEEGPKIVVEEEPEEHHRPRYESEGFRAPIRGRSSKACPTIRIEGAPEHTTGEVTVTLVHANNSTCYPACHLVGEVTKQVGQGTNMAVKFDQLRIQRQIHSSDGKRAARGQASNRARLMFEAHLNTIHGAITVTAFSRPIILEAAQTPGTLAAVCPSSGSMNGGEDIVVLGHKLGPPCTVEFVGIVNGQEWLAPADVCRDKFQPASNAILVKTPKFPFANLIKKPFQVKVRVRSGKQQQESSNHMIFTYQPPESHSNCHLVQGGSPLPPNPETRSELLFAYGLCTEGAYEAQKPANTCPGMMGHPSPAGFDIPTNIPRVMARPQDSYGPPSPPHMDDLWPKPFETPGPNMLFHSDPTYPATSCGGLPPSTSCGSLALPTSCGNIVLPTSSGGLAPPTSCGSLALPTSCGSLAPPTSCGPTPTHPLLPNSSMVQDDVPFPPVTSSSATPLLSSRVSALFGSQY